MIKKPFQDKYLGGALKYFLIFTPIPGEMIPNLTVVFFFHGLKLNH